VAIWPGRLTRTSPAELVGPDWSTRKFGQFFNFNLFLIYFLKLTSGKYYLHLVTSLAAPGGVAWQASFAAPHAAAR
jgi:hypothetical protein